jgi:hypothetical protein
MSRHPGSNGLHDAGNLMPHDHRVIHARPIAPGRVDVGVTDAYKLDRDPHFEVTGLAAFDGAWLEGRRC